MSDLDDLIANHARIVARYGPGIDLRRLPVGCDVTVPVDLWPEVPLVPTALRPRERLSLGVTCGRCGSDDWTMRRNHAGAHRWRVCRPCAAEACRVRQRRKWARIVAARKAKQTSASPSVTSAVMSSPFPT